MVATINKPKQAKKDYTLSLSVLESKEKIKEIQLKPLLEEEEQLLRGLQQEEKGQQKQQYSKRQKQQSQFYDLNYWWRTFSNSNNRLGACCACEVHKRTCRYCGGTIYWTQNSKTPFNYADNSLHQYLKGKGF